MGSKGRAYQFDSAEIWIGGRKLADVGPVTVQNDQHAPVERVVPRPRWSTELRLEDMEDAGRFFEDLQALVPIATRIDVRSFDELRHIPREREPLDDTVLGLPAVLVHSGSLPVCVDPKVPHRRARVVYSDCSVQLIELRPAKAAPSLHDLRGMVRAARKRAWRQWRRSLANDPALVNALRECDAREHRLRDAESAREQRKRARKDAALDSFCRNGFSNDRSNT